MDEFGRNKNEEKHTPSHNIQSRDVRDDIAECSPDGLTPATDDMNVKMHGLQGKNLVGNKTAAKDSCNIFLRWTHEGKTERMRTLHVPKMSTLLAKVNHCSEKGSCGEEMKMTEYEVLDYAEYRMPDNVTVLEVYQNTKLGRTTLKLYYIFMYDCIVFINIVYSGLYS